MSNVTLQNKYLQRIHDFVLLYMRDEPVRIFLFGSWSKGTAHHSSDVDIALYYKEHYNPGKIDALREALEESTIPYRVDIIDMQQAAEPILEEIKKDGVLWKR